MHIAWDGKATNYDRLPPQGDLKLDPQGGVRLLRSNETIQGVQFQSEPETGERAAGVRRVERLPAAGRSTCKKYGLIYACAQKNAGPAGVTVVIIRKDLLAAEPANRCRAT